jgi:putative acetyltransferase
MFIREFHFGDEPALHAVYHSAIHQIAIRDYTVEQVNAWAPDTLDQEVWVEKMRAIKPFVAVSGDKIVGYGDVQANGYIDHFFVSGTCPRQGVGRLLMEQIHETAKRLGLPELTSDVSRTAQPFFEHFGFHIVEHRSPVVRGVVVPNAGMRKDLVANPGFTRSFAKMPAKST